MLDAIEIPHFLDDNAMIHQWLKRLEDISLSLKGPLWRYRDYTLDTIFDNFGKYCGNINAYIAKLVGDKMLAFNMSAHGRLGSQSVAHGINPDVIPIIYKHLFKN